MMAFCKLIKKNPTQEKNGVLTQAPLEKESEDSLRGNMQCFIVRCNLKAERLMKINEPGRREENQGQAIQNVHLTKEWIGNVFPFSILLLSHLSRFPHRELAPCHRELAPCMCWPDWEVSPNFCPVFPYPSPKIDAKNQKLWTSGRCPLR